MLKSNQNMYLIDIIPLTRIPHAQPQILSYFYDSKLKAGVLVQIPLGRRQEEGVVVSSHDLANHKMEIKSASFELRNITKIISVKPILTKQQIELALFLGQYYFCSPGIFAKMMLSKKPTTDYRLPTTAKRQKLIIVPTVTQTEKIAVKHKNSALWHSGLKAKQLNKTWWRIKTGRAQTIIGTRSALFLPFANLKEVLVEDANNPNHKSWDMFPHYDSRLIAQKLTEIFKCKITFKDFCHPEHIRFAQYKLRKGSRGSVATRAAKPLDSSPTAQNDNIIAPVIIDMRQELKDGNFSIFSISLYEAVKKALTDNKQIILFINRRGAANFILCRDCGYIAKCPNCDAPLAYHLINNKPSLLCHHCGLKDAPPATCPVCQSWRIKTVGSGTQKIETETKKFFPNAKILRLDSDNSPKPKDQQKIIADFINHKTDILIATQMIFSWPTELTTAQPAVIGLLSADTLLHIPDFRSGERTWQTIMAFQSVIARRHKPTKQSRNITATHGIATLPTVARDDRIFIIQTYNPDNSVLKYVKNNDYAGFAKEDMATRKTLNYPPFSQIIKLTFRHRDGKKAGQEAKILAAKLSLAIAPLSGATKLNNVIASPAFAEQNNSEYSKNNQLTSSPQTCPASRERRGEGGLGGGVEPQLSDTTSPQPPPQLKGGGKNDIEISPALPAFLPRERGKYVWNIIIKFLPFPTPHFEKGGLARAKLSFGGIFTAPDFLRRRNSLLQYVPTGWKIDVDSENLL
ncbi:primosomal protein N' [Patescibacteria group bacterium]|nr:primosomal protein N' [Patescibacteria group bacterium]